MTAHHKFMQKVHGVPWILHFHAYLMHRGYLPAQASAIARGALEIAQKFGKNPDELTPQDIDKFVNNRVQVIQSTKWLCATLCLEYARFVGEYPNGVPLSWDTTTGMLGEVLHLRSRRVVTLLKYYATAHHQTLEDFRAAYRIYLAPLEFYTYAVKELKQRTPHHYPF